MQIARNCRLSLPCCGPESSARRGCQAAPASITAIATTIRKDATVLSVMTVPAPQLAAELTLCGNSPLSLYLFDCHHSKQK